MRPFGKIYCQTALDGPIDNDSPIVRAASNIVSLPDLPCVDSDSIKRAIGSTRRPTAFERRSVPKIVAEIDGKWLGIKIGARDSNA